MSTSASLSFSGLASGIDTAAIVDALMKLERMPIDRVKAQKTQLTAKQGVVQEINGLLGKLKDAAAKLSEPGALQGKTATAADPTVLSASAGAAAAKGVYNVQVTALAQAHTMASAPGVAFTAGRQLDITAGGATTSVAMEAGDTVQTFADRVNAADDPGVSASVVNGRLVLIARESGTAGAISVGGSAAADFGFTTTQAAQDATATINGVAVTSSGNTIQGAISGVDVVLAKEGTTTVTVGADPAGAEATVTAFVDAYNALIRNVRLATSYDAATKTAGTLQGDSSISSMGGQIRSIAGAAVAGLGGAYDSLAQIGITSARDGTMTLDGAKLRAALDADPAAVAAVLGREDAVAGVGAGDGIARQIRHFADTFSSQTLSERLTGFTASLKRMDDKIATLEDVMTVREQRLKQQFAAMETAVAQFQAQGGNLAAQLAGLSA
ncbi:flagellar filament capping protein FliD [Miltoncostaea marina]|uniref:flagellar filament capping protein FliD n=1 Tax=Miltoncostaea marina TaxID=2843215 RepID=UPI001C3D52E4|nr:flagellar filament capping protein FliD [Miltoncostaea marina]